MSDSEERSDTATALSTLCKLWLGDIWDRMGLDEEAAEGRERTAIKVVTTTLKEMREEEEKTLVQIMDRVEKHGIERTRLAKELGEEVEDPDSTCGLVHLERVLRHEVNKLKAKKEERMAKVLELKKMDKAVCRQMQMEPYAISSTTIPSKVQFDGLKKHLDDMTSLRNKRLAKFAEAKLSIVSTLEQLECEPNTSFERTVVCENDDDFILSADNLDAVENYLAKLTDKLESNRKNAEEMRERMVSIITKLELGEDEKQKVYNELNGHTPTMLQEIKRRLDELEVLKLEKIGQIVEATRKELHEYWDACYYSQKQRDKFDPIHSSEYTEELLEEHEREIARIKAYYDSNYDMFKLVRKRQELWNKMLELEERKKDPTHLFKAKGPALLIEERERKRVQKNLPKVDAELQEAMAEYQEKNGEPFLVGGQPYDEFMERQETEYQREREMESEMKRREKKAEIEQETIYGISRPVTPAKLRANLTSAAANANATASLKRKVPGGGPATPGGTANMAKRMHMAPGSATLGGQQNRRNITAVGGSAQMRSKYTLRGQASSRRRILADSNTSVVHAGMHHGAGGGGGVGAGTGKRHMAAVEESLSSITSENFVRGAPVNSTFGPTPEASSNGGVFKFTAGNQKSTSSSRSNMR